MTNNAEQIKLKLDYIENILKNASLVDNNADIQIAIKMTNEVKHHFKNIMNKFYDLVDEIGEE